MRAWYFMVITRSRQKLIEMENCFFSQCGLNVDITNYCCIISQTFCSCVFLQYFSKGSANINAPNLVCPGTQFLISVRTTAALQSSYLGRTNPITSPRNMAQFWAVFGVKNLEETWSLALFSKRATRKFLGSGSKLQANPGNENLLILEYGGRGPRIKR